MSKICNKQLTATEKIKLQNFHFSLLFFVWMKTLKTSIPGKSLIAFSFTIIWVQHLTQIHVYVIYTYICTCVIHMLCKYIFLFYFIILLICLALFLHFDCIHVLLSYISILFFYLFGHTYWATITAAMCTFIFLYRQWWIGHFVR